MQKRPDLTIKYSIQKRFSGSTTLENWNVWLYSGNYIDFQGQRNDLHRHSYYEACLVLEGKGRFIYGKEEFHIEKGDLFISDPDIIHEIVSEKVHMLKIHFISFSLTEEIRNRDSRSIPIQSKCIHEFVNNHATIVKGCGYLESLFMDLKAAASESSKIKWYVKNQNILIGIMMEAILLSTENLNTLDMNTEMDSRLKLAVGYIKDNSFRKLSVEEISMHSSTTPRTLRRLMNAHYNMTVIQKCNELRIEETARYLIANPEETLAEVGYRFGFENPSDFCRSFKKRYKVTPGQFKKKRSTTFL